MAKSKKDAPRTMFVRREELGRGVNKDGQEVAYYQYKVKLYPDYNNKKYSVTVFLPADTPLAKRSEEKGGGTYDGCFIQYYANRPFYNNKGRGNR